MGEVKTMALVALTIVVLLFWALSACLLPHPVSGRRRRLDRIWSRVVRLVEHRKSAAPDPFDTLRVQIRLGELADKIRRLEATPRVYARAHRLTALQTAYDDLLHEACRLAGASTQEADEPGEERRWHEEQELATRGWSW
jgi:hypothetical protein